MKIYIKLRQSGEVKQVQSYDWLECNQNAHFDTCESEYYSYDCDLCDEQGRLLVAEQSDFTNIRAVITGSHDPKRISNDMLVWLKLAVDEYFRGLTNTPSEGEEEKK